MDLSYKNFTDTDFDSIKESLKTHLKSQDIFKDFNFDGSAINVLMNLLAYNTQYNAYYLNMMASEKFISHAQKRESVVGLANNIGYVPASAKSSTAKLTFDMLPVGSYTDYIEIPKNTKFNTSIDSTLYTFYTTKTSVYMYDPIAAKYPVIDLEVKEGKHFVHKFTSSPSNYYTIPNDNVDISRLTVKVKSSASEPDSNAIEYTYYTNVLDIRNTSKVYFVQEVDSKKFEIYFGDGVLGSSVALGSQIIVDYYTCSGTTPNGTNSFTLEGDIPNVASISNLVSTRASDGADIESIDSIRLNSTKSFAVQDRAVVESDYATLIKRLLPVVTDVSVWGGENATPKQYGKVFMSAIKEGSSQLTQAERSYLTGQLTLNYSPLGIIPEFVESDIFNLAIATNVIISPNRKDDISSIVSQVINTIKTKIRPNLSKYNAVLYESRVQEIINSASTDIVSNSVSYSIYTYIGQKIFTPATNYIQFPIGLKNITSSQFTYGSLSNCSLVDDGLGNISIETLDTVVVKYAMKINYTLGRLEELSAGLLYQIGLDQTVRVIGVPINNDIGVSLHNILDINDYDITVTPV